MNLFENAERLLRIAVDTDAWIAIVGFCWI